MCVCVCVCVLCNLLSARYILTMSVDMAAELQSSEAAVKQAVKQRLPNVAFRRRIDYIGLGRI